MHMFLIPELVLYTSNFEHMHLIYKSLQTTLFCILLQKSLLYYYRGNSRSNTCNYYILSYNTCDYSNCCDHSKVKKKKTMLLW